MGVDERATGSCVRCAYGYTIRGMPSSPRRRADTLDRMVEHGVITEEMFIAGRRFQSAFRRAALDSTVCSSPDVIRAERRLGGGHMHAMDTSVAGRQAVRDAIDALGGTSSPAASVVWAVVGLEQAIAEAARRQRWGGRPVDRHMATGLLIAALAVLAGPGTPEADRGGRAAGVQGPRSARP